MTINPSQTMCRVNHDCAVEWTRTDRPDADVTFTLIKIVLPVCAYLAILCVWG